MPQFTLQLSVTASASTVFSDLTTAAPRADILPDVASCSEITPTPGAQWNEVHHVEEDAVEWALTMKRIEQDTLLEYEGTTRGMQTHVTVQLQPDGDQTTIVWQQRMTFEGLFPKIVGWFVNRSQRAKLRYALDRHYNSDSTTT